MRRALPHAGVFAALALAFGCSSNIDPRPFVLDCSINDKYDFNVIQPLEPGATLTWFPYGDPTPGSITTATLQPIPEGRCESTGALVLSSSGHHDWGSGFGDYAMPMAPVDATGFEGVSFWARAPLPHTTLGFQVTVNDKNTDQNGGICMQPMVTNSGGEYTYNEAGMMVPVGGDLPSPRDCGNGFMGVVRVTRDWQLYTLPFESFRQTAQPNLIPSGIDRSGIHQFSFNIPKDSITELWIDDLGVYRRRTDAAPESAAVVGSDGVDTDSADSSDSDTADSESADSDAADTDAVETGDVDTISSDPEVER